MPPQHTCECKICGFQWRRNDQEFLDAAENKTSSHTEQEAFRKLNKFQPNQISSKDLGTNGRTVKRKDIVKDDINEFAQPFPMFGPITETKIRTRNGKETNQNTGTIIIGEKFLRKPKSNIHPIVERVTRSRCEIVSSRQNSISETEAYIKGSEKTSIVKTACGKTGKKRKQDVCLTLEQAESSHNVVKDVTEMLDDVLVIPEAEIIAEKEVVIKFELDEERQEIITKDGTGYLKKDYGKTRENMGTKRHNRDTYYSEVNNRLKDSEESSTRGVPHNMPGE